VWLAVLVGGGASGAMVFDRLSSAMDPVASTESMRARDAREAATGEGETIVALITGAPALDVAETAADLALLLGVHTVASSDAGQLPPPDGGGIVLAVTLSAGRGDALEDATIEAVTAAFDTYPAEQVVLGGYPVIDVELGATAEADLILAEAIALPIVLILLGFAVRSVLGAAFGMVLVLTTVTGALALLLALSAVTTVSTFAINVVTMFGIGLSVDYGLLLMTRFRRERVAGASVAQAVTVTMSTAGRTVAFSGLTVAVALAGLLVFSEPIVRSMAYGGIGAVIIAVAASLTLLPVLLHRFGHRIPPGRADGRGAVDATVFSPLSRFGRLARLVQQRPVTVALGSISVLAVLALPLTGLRLEGLDARALPSDSTARQDTAALEESLPDLARTPITVLAHTDTTDPALTVFLQNLEGLRHVAAVTARPETPAGLAVIDVRTTGPAAGREAMSVVHEIRDLDPGFATEVGGLAAQDADLITSLQARAPYAAALIALATFAILLLVTGGVLIAVKAVLMNVLSLAASLGALVWIFQDGHLAGSLGFTATGGLELIIVILTAAFAFGLSTDYEVFLLSSVMAARHEGHDSDTAVAAGISRTGPIITIAAALIIVVFIGFAAGDLLIIKQLGVGLAVAVILDATLIRLALTPALMTLLKHHNWTGPRLAHRTSQLLWHHNTP
jgi:RND superfamily putative drug exporter